MAQEFFDDESSAHLFQLIHMLQRSAMMHMGMLQDSEGESITIWEKQRLQSIHYRC